MFNRLAFGLNQFLKRDVYSLVDLEVNDTEDPFTFVRSDGALVSFLEIKGSPKLVGKDEFANRLSLLIERTAGELKQPGHRLEFFFMRDPYAGPMEVMRAQMAATETAKSLDLDATSILKARERILGRQVASERVFLVLHTTPQLLPMAVMSRESKKRMQNPEVKRLGLKPGVHGQSPYVAYDALRKPHQAFVNNLVAILKTGLLIEKLECHEAIKRIRQIYAPHMTSENYRPYLVGDRIPIRFMNEFPSDTDLSWVMQPSISHQLFPSDIEVCAEDSTLVETGGYFFSPILLDLGPQQYKPFSELFDMIHQDVAWCMKICIDTGDDAITSALNTKRSLAMILALTNRRNKEVKDDIDALLSTSRREPKVSTSISFCCWSSLSGGRNKSRDEALDEARKNREITIQAIQSWGSPDVLVEKGDPIDAFLSVLPGLKRRQVAPAFPSMLGDVLGLAPMARPASPYSQGSMLFTTLDRKLWPYAVGSSQQTMHIDIIYARPGSGKSVLMSVKNLALLTSPGLEGLLPRISCIDIGFSSKLFVDQVRHMLPQHKHHLLLHAKLQNSKEYSINLFDTPLGCDKPFPTDRALISNLLGLILSPTEGGKIDGLAQLASTLVDELYEHKNKYPNKYERHMDDLVDAGVDQLELTYDDDTEWREIRNQLFAKGMELEALHAHRFTVPTLTDASSVLAQSDTIREIFGEARSATGEPLIKACQRQLLSAARDFPILSGQTKFSLNAARIVALDLMDVSPQGGAAEARQTSIMYLLAFNLLTREFFRKNDVVQFIPESYKQYHAKQIEANASVPSHLCMDEFHRSSHAEQVRANVKTVMREGRKFGVMVTLCSQRETDFDNDMVEMATNVWVLDKGTKNSRRYIRDVFGPSEDAMRQLEVYVNGPSEMGANLLYLGVNKGGNIEQILTLKLTPHELWALSSTPIDVRVRDRLVQSIGYGAAIDMLGQRFPGGSCNKYMESMKHLNKGDMARETTDEDMATQSVIQLVRELSESYLEEH